MKLNKLILPEDKIEKKYLIRIEFNKLKLLNDKIQKKKIFYKDEIKRYYISQEHK